METLRVKFCVKRRMRIEIQSEDMELGGKLCIFSGHKFFDKQLVPQIIETENDA